RAFLALLSQTASTMGVSRSAPVGWLRSCRAALSMVAIAFSSYFVFAQSPRLELLQAMLQRPSDPWPRGQGHVLLAVPGCSEEGKGYHEPGGSFSPSFASFGVSLWITDNDGKIVATSDSLPSDETEQRLVWRTNEKLPAIQTETP